MISTESFKKTGVGQLLVRAKRRLQQKKDVPVTPADVARLRDAGVFDPAYYLERYPDVAVAGLGAIEHYVEYGAKEGRDPSAWFSSSYYLKKNPDVAKAGINPLLHFSEHGWMELRNPSQNFDTAWYQLSYMVKRGAVGNPLAYYIAEGRQAGDELRSVDGFSAQDRQSMADGASVLINSGGCSMVQLQHLHRVALGIKRPDIAEQALSQQAVLCPDNADIYQKLGALQASQGKWWLAVEALQRATSLEPRAGWFFRLGHANEAMRRFDAAAEAFGSALALKPKDADWHYRHGYALERGGRQVEASEAYARALSLHKDKAVRRLGIGVLHQNRGLWEAARAEYRREIKRSALSAELRYRLGYACERCYDWEEALAAYESAIRISVATVPIWHYRRGFVLERTHNWESAAAAYAVASAKSDKATPYWHYRQGYALMKAGAFERSCEAFLATRQAQTLQGQPLAKDDLDNTEDQAFRSYLAEFSGEHEFAEMLAVNALLPEPYLRMAQCRERDKNWAGAAEAYGRAIERSSKFHPAWNYRQGFCLYMAGLYEQACESFLNTRIFRQAHGVSEKEFSTKGLAIQYSTVYAEYRENLPVRDNVILYESHIGSSVSCNPLAIFKALIDDPEYADYLHVWVLNDPASAPESLRSRKNVVLTTRPSDGYFRWIATAKYLINNTGFPPYFVRRPGQRYLATWHGTPLKTLGKQQQYKFLEHKRTQRTFLHATHLISPNPHTSDVLLDSYDIRHIAGGIVAETGYPRIDLTLNASETRKAEIRNALGVSGTRPVVLYAPTWRGTLETVSYDVSKVEEDIQYLSARHDCDLIFRGHHLLEKAFSINSQRRDGMVVAPPSIDTNELLSVVDVLITDYSSIFFDFLPLVRPVIYHIYDEEEYRQHRGMYFSMDEMPGYKCPDLESLSDALGNALLGRLHDEAQHHEAIRRFCPHEDGRAAERAINLLFHDATDCAIAPPVLPPRKILIHGGGLKSNGITTSFLNLLAHVDPTRVHVTVVVSADSMENDPAARTYFERIPEYCGVVGSHFHVTATLEEQWLRRQHTLAETPFSGERLARMRTMYDREYLHNFGEARFDTLVAFSGYDAFWASVFGLNQRDIRKVVYLHSEMKEEYKARYPELLRMFYLYPFFDGVVSVSQENSRSNMDNLADWLGIESSRFTSCENMQDPDRILRLAEEELPAADQQWFSGGGPVFINIGRLSVEKGQDRLIRAFARISHEHPQARLLILGDGPLRGALQTLIAELGMGERVLLAGSRANPYSYLQRSSCFVLSSHHEAKTMSLIEALIVGMPFVATDIVGNQGIKKDFPDYFFEASEEGLLEGMRAFLKGDLPPAALDWRKHQEMALEQFHRGVLGG